MEKEEFLRTLGGALSGEVPQHIIQENLRYYDNYISDEMRKGRTEADIIEELGGPRIIAKTIIDAAEAGGEALGENGQSGFGQGGFSQSDYGQTDSYTEDDRRDGYGSFDPFHRESGSGSFHVYNLNKWYWKLIGIAVLVLVIFAVFTIIGGIASLLLSPVGLILIIAWLLWRNQR